MGKPNYAICEQQRRRSACASAQSDQHFVVRCLDNIIPIVSIFAISCLSLASVAEQTGLRVTWSKTPKTVTRLIYMWEKDKGGQLELSGGVPVRKRASQR